MGRRKSSPSPLLWVDPAQPIVNASLCRLSSGLRGRGSDHRLLAGPGDVMRRSESRGQMSGEGSRRDVRNSGSLDFGWTRVGGSKSRAGSSFSGGEVRSGTRWTVAGAVWDPVGLYSNFLSEVFFP